MTKKTQFEYDLIAQAVAMHVMHGPFMSWKSALKDLDGWLDALQNHKTKREKVQ
jgi:hypothetical protein